MMKCFIPIVLGGNLSTALLGKGIGNKSLRFGWGVEEGKHLKDEDVQEDKVGIF